MIAGLDSKSPHEVRVWGADEIAEARAWCYLRRSRAIYEVDGRRIVSARPAVARALVLAHGRLITTGRQAPHKHTSAALRQVRAAERRAARLAEARA